MHIIYFTVLDSEERLVNLNKVMVYKTSYEKMLPIKLPFSYKPLPLNKFRSKPISAFEVRNKRLPFIGYSNGVYYYYGIKDNFYYSRFEGEPYIHKIQDFFDNQLLLYKQYFLLKSL